MFTLTSLRAAVAVAAAPMVLAGSALAAKAAAPGWRVDKVIVITGPAGSGDDATSMTSVVAISPADAWAAGSAGDDRGNGPGFVERWAGRSWQRVRLPSAVAQYWNDAGGGNADDLIAASSAVSIWVFAGDGKFIRRSGGHWTTGRAPGAMSIGSRLVYISTVDVLSRSDVWIFGTISRGSGLHYVPYAAHFNGHAWAAQPFPGTGEIAGVSVVSARDMWAVTGPTSDTIDAGTPSVVHWNGSSWRHPDLTAVLADLPLLGRQVVPAVLAADRREPVPGRAGEGAAPGHRLGGRRRVGRHHRADRAEAVADKAGSLAPPAARGCHAAGAIESALDLSCQFGTGGALSQGPTRPSRSAVRPPRLVATTLQVRSSARAGLRQGRLESRLRGARPRFAASPRRPSAGRRAGRCRG